MGQNQSNLRIYQKLHQVIPQVNNSGDKPWSGFFDKTLKPFASEEDRKQFIYATITVLSHNGVIDLNNHEFRLLYSRRGNDRLVARIVAEQEGIVKAQIEPAADGKDQAQAFVALRRHIEMQLDEVLREVPGASTGKATRYRDEDDDMPRRQSVGRTPSGNSQPGSPIQPVSSAQDPVQIQAPNEAPPAYGKAVKEWKIDEKKH